MNRIKTILIFVVLITTVGCAGFKSSPQYNHNGARREKAKKNGEAVSDTTQGFWERFFEDAKPRPAEEDPDDN